MTADLVERLLAGDRRALARVLSQVENQTEAGRAALRTLYPHTGHAHVVGVTGSAGSGKSTLVAGLAKEFRRRSKTIGIVAVDPTSPFSHGAILGDRIRMQELAGDPGVFIRSMATRGALGGLAAATNDVVAVLDAAGKDVILVETVGAGQDEVTVAATAQTTIVVNTPGTGDDIQAIKAGLLEIADVLVVNKADLPDCERLVGHLATLLSLAPAGPWKPPILRTVATRDEGTPELADAVEEHHRHLRRSDRMQEYRRAQARARLLAAAQAELLRRLLAAPNADGHLEALVAKVASREMDPYSAASALIDQDPVGQRNRATLP
ncbi:MAG: methylmalonyl Co-A mutase-associated GTPase MeaB [Dehalococcoidia bacterium]